MMQYSNRGVPKHTNADSFSAKTLIRIPQKTDTFDKD